MNTLDTNLPRGASPASPDEDSAQSPFHAGEHWVQERLGVRDIETWARKAVRPYLPEEHRAFHTAMPFLVVAARDEWGRPWATNIHDAGHLALETNGPEIAAAIRFLLAKLCG